MTTTDCLCSREGRVPVPPECVYQCVTTEPAVPLMTAVQSRVHLSTLALTEDGDVFYVVFQPLSVWRKNRAGAAGIFEFQEIGTDQWYEQDQLGSPNERVVVIHNTRKYRAQPAEEC